MQIDNLFAKHVKTVSLSNFFPEIKAVNLYLILSLVTNDNKERSMLGLYTVLDECMDTGINNFFNHVF